MIACLAITVKASMINIVLIIINRIISYILRISYLKIYSNSLQNTEN